MTKVYNIKDIDKMFNEIDKDFESFVRGVIDDQQIRAIDMAPMDSGALKNSIRLGINSETIVYEEGSQSPDNAKTFNTSTLDLYDLGDTVNLVVGAPYGKYVEEGTSNQSPQPFLRTAAEELDHSVRYAKQNIKKYRK